MNQEKTIPLYGVGPFYVCVILFLDVLGILLSCFKLIPYMSQGIFRIICIVLGAIFVAINVFLWIQAALRSKLDDCIQENRLVTTGIYAWMRNPIYSAITFALFGILLIYGNLLLLPLLLVDWLFLTVLMKNTEEKWLYIAFGQEYKAYCQKVNRFFPCFPKKNNHNK